MHQSIKFILFWNGTLHVADGLSVHYQEFKTVNTATGICQTDTAVCLQTAVSVWQLYVQSWTLDDGRRVSLKNKRPTWCHLLFFFTSYVLNMFRTLIYLSSGACDYSVELPHWSYCSWFRVCWSFGVVGLERYACCRLKLQPATRIPL